MLPRVRRRRTAAFSGPPAYLISHPDHIEQVLVKSNHDFVKDRYTRAELRILGNGLLVNEGVFWRRQRHLAQPAFHRRRVEAYGETMVSYTDRPTRIACWTAGVTARCVTCTVR